MSYINILRPVNLLFVILTQCVLHYFVVVSLSGGTVLLDGLLFPLFTLVTAIIAASGYVINDVFDWKTDKVNKPEKSFIPDSISVKNAMLYYALLVIAGFLLSIYIANKTDSYHYLWLYPVAVIMLYLYSAYFKSSVLTGNIIVSLFIAGVTGVVFLAQSLSKNQDSSSSAILMEICALLMLLSFILNLIREIIKDLEDAEGDKANGIQTVATRLTEKQIKYILYALIVLMAGFLIFWMATSDLADNFIIRSFYFIFIIAPLLMMIPKIQNARIKQDYSKLSKLSKIILLAGIISIPVIAGQL